MCIRDRPTGAQAALAAGMTVVGFCGAGHIVDRGAHGAMLRAVGVHHIAEDFADIATIGSYFVIPAQAGIQRRDYAGTSWIPACAGMTRGRR